MSSDRLALITGTSSGVGAALVDRLLEDGWVVFGVARREVKRPGQTYQHIQADLSDPSIAQSVIAPRVQAEMAFTPVSRFAVVNNAASSGQMRNFGDQDAGETFRNIALNLSSPMSLMDMAVRIRPENSALRIVNLSSGLAYRALAGVGDYCASKAGLHMAGQVLAEEQHSAIGVLSYAPGIVDTEMQQELRGQSTDKFTSVDVFKAMHDEGRLVSAAEVIQPIAEFIASDAVGFFEDRYQSPAV